MTDTRAIEPLEFADIQPGTPPTGLPELTWISPTDVRVDTAYQRDISPKSLALIRRIVENFDWTKFKPPVVTWCDDGLRAIDGQHSLLGAASHPGIDRVPVIIVETKDVAAQATSFVAHNRDRLPITAVQLHAAAIAAGETSAIEVARVCTAAGVTLVRTNPSRTDRVGDTTAVVALESLVKRCGASLAIIILEKLVEAECAPIVATQIKAAELLLTNEEFRNDFDPTDLVKVIRDTRADATREAGLLAATHKIQQWRALAHFWFRQVPKKRRKPAAAETEQAPRSQAPDRKAASSETRTKSPSLPTGPRVLDDLSQGVKALNPATEIKRSADEIAPRAKPARAPDSARIPFTGEPPPGRSALDQRRATEKRR